MSERRAYVVAADVAGSFDNCGVGGRLAVVASSAALPFYVHAQPIQKVDPEPADFAETINAALAAGQYDRLEAMAADYRRPEALFTAGVPKLSIFYKKLESFQQSGRNCEYHKDETEFEPRRQALQAWRAALPDSITPRIALARLWLRYAWRARGCGYSNDVSDENWAAAQDRLAEAQDLLIDPKTEDDPATLEAMIEIGALRGYDHERLRLLYARAVGRFPWYMPYYSQHANFIQVKWGGRPGELEFYLSDMLRPERGVRGQVAFAWATRGLLTVLSKEEFIKIKPLDFPAVLQAYQIREEQYGLRSKDWNAIFMLSGWALDCESSHTALLQIGDQWDPEIWTSRIYFDEFVAWFHAHSRY